MARQTKMGAARLPVGTHQVKLARIDDVERGESEFGAGYRAVFANTAGEMSRTVGRYPAIDNAYGKLVRELSGRDVLPGDDIDLDSYIGRDFEIEVVERGIRRGGVEIERITPVTK